MGFDGMASATVAQLALNLRDRTTANGVSKAYSMTGWRGGFAGGPKPLIDALTRLQQAADRIKAAVERLL